MEALIQTIETTPVIDHHAHNLLLPSDLDDHDFMAATSEATGSALKFASSTLAHLRALKQLSLILKCEPTWEAVKDALKVKRKEPSNAWSRKCLHGIETVLIDDGLDPSSVYGYDWHDKLTRSKCKRIVRIEKVAEEIMTDQLEQYRGLAPGKGFNFQEQFISRFTTAIEEAVADPEVAGFKSVICYRVGLKIPAFDGHARVAFPSSIEDLEKLSHRLEDERLNPYLVHLTAKVIGSKKPLQFHTGLGDNDIDLGLSNPNHLQSFIESYPEVHIVLLHASYPFTREAGYLASVYENCWLDIGEVFPMVSQYGQERVIEQALELCPSEKLMWSTDGHWFPETYLLAVIQIRQGLQKVLGMCIERGSLTTPEAIKIVQDILFNTANQLYDLKLPLVPVNVTTSSDVSLSKTSWANNFAQLQRFLDQEPSVQFLRLQWLDYTNTLRLRILPIKQALRMFSEGRFIGIVEAVLGLLQPDIICPGFSATNEYTVYPQFAGLRLGSRKGYATVQCEFQTKNGDEVQMCPRTSLRQQVEKAGAHGVEFLVGYEIEVVFMNKKIQGGELKYGGIPIDEGHAWSTARALHSDDLMDVLETIFEKLERSGITLEQFHPESSPGQFEFILGPLSPVLAVDALIAAKEIIQSAAANAGMRATLFPKPFPEAIGTGAHIHISFTPAQYWKMFYAGVLKHLRAIASFTYSNDASYERVADGVWAGSTWITWGTQNRETPLRRIEGSHFEIRCVDGLANPFLVLASIIGAGVQGILDEEPLEMKDCLQDPSTITAREREEFGIIQQFPSSISEALGYLEADEQLRRILSNSAVEGYLRVKRTESEMLQKMEPIALEYISVTGVANEGKSARMANVPEIKKLAMIGCGSMGGGMALLFAEHGITVLLNDPSESTVDSLLKTAEKDGLRNMLEKHLDYEDLCKNLDSPKVFVFSLPHGTVGDSVVEGLHPYLEKGDLIIDASNENWQNTQRRQGKLVTQGVHYVGMGVSGGYQAARRGPSMCPGAEDRALDMVLPLLQKVAARDARGNPCVGRCGMGGSGHYVKMIHNGIEHGMMSAQSEAWQIMNIGLGMTYDEIGDVFAKWNKEGELRGTFLIDIGAQISKQRDGKGRHVLSVVEDKVVQDIDGTEGTGVWSSGEAIRLHVPAPTLSDAHYVRVASAFRKDRKKIKATFGGHFPLEKWTGSEKEKPAFLEDLRKAVYTAFVAAFVQGINIIDLADQENKWSIDFSQVIQIWRNGCIIRADYIADLLEEIFKDPKDLDRDLLHNERIAKELSTNFPALKKVVGMGVQMNAIIPSLSASLEYLKYSVNTVLPTQFYEAQLDFFGKHMFDLKSEPAGEPKTGHHHYEWKPA